MFQEQLLEILFYVKLGNTYKNSNDYSVRKYSKGETPLLEVPHIVNDDDIV